MPRLGIAIRPQLVGASPYGKHSASVKTLPVFVCYIWGIHYAYMFGIVRVGHLVARITIYAVTVACLQTGPVSRSRAAGNPSACTMTTDAEVSCPVKVLLCHSQGRPEARVPAGTTHRTAAPSRRRFRVRVSYVVPGMAIVTFVGRLKISNLIRLCSGHLDFRRNYISSKTYSEKEQKYKKNCK
jgi:hypothetical protein